MTRPDDLPDSASFFRDFTELAAQICHTRAALFSLTGDDCGAENQSLAAQVNLGGEAAHALAFCREALRSAAFDKSRSDEAILVVRDASADARFAGNPLVTGGAGLRFCAAAPLTAPNGRARGVLCVCDPEPHDLGAGARDALTMLARRASAHLELRADAERLRLLAGAARRSEDYRNLFQLANDSILILQPEDEVVLDVNDKACETYGLTRAEFVGRSIKEISVDVGRGEEHIVKLLAVGNSHAFESTQLHTNGTQIHFLINSSVIEYGGRRAILSINRDITERKRAEEALRQAEHQLIQAQKMDSIGTLAGGVAHDFNNVIAAIMGYSELALRRLAAGDPDEPNDRMRAYLTEIRQSADRAASLTRQLLAFSRGQQLERRVVNPNDTILGMLEMFRRLIGEDIDLEARLAPDVSAVFVDPGQLEQVLMNLTINARDAMPGGGKLVIETRNIVLDEVYCRSHPYVEPGPFVAITVSDTGAGMNEATRARIFEPFFTTKARGKGTGLGLSTAYGIVKQHSGAIDVESAPGRGATFTVSLPMTDVEVETVVPVPVSRAKGGGETILVAEDESALRKLVREALEELGYEVLIARDGEEATTIFVQRSQEIDLLLLDMVMPRLNGYDALRRILAIRPDVPVIFMSGYSLEAVRDNALKHYIEANNVPILTKPYRSDALGRIVRETLDATAHPPR